jgi:FkbM family methyltransferase
MEKLSPLNRFIAAFVRRLWRFGHFKGRGFLIYRLLPFVRAMPTRYGPTIRIHRHDYTNRAAVFGAYGQEVAGWVRRLRPDDLFLDIGANAGIFSLIANDHVTRGKVFAFEPNPNLYEDLRYNIRLNGAKRVTPLNAAISERTGTFTLFHNPWHSGGGALQLGALGKRPSPETEAYTVLAIAPKHLDAMLDEARRRRVCMKIDVEGHELAVLRGLREAGLLARTAWAIVEIDPVHLSRFGAAAADLYRLMEDAGFACEKGCDFADHYDEFFTRLMPSNEEGRAVDEAGIQQESVLAPQ